MSRLRPLWPYLALAAFALFAAQPLARAELLCTDDGFFHMARAVVLEHALQAGEFFPRWAPYMAHGYGFPHFNYYAPLASYVLAGLHGLGLIYPLALHLFFGLCVWLAGVGTYLFIREDWGAGAGIVGAVVYLTSPYLAFNIVVRGALAETFALVWLPFTLLALRRALVRNEAAGMGGWGLLAALAFAALLYTHNTTSLAAAPLLGGYVVCLALLRRDRGILLRGGFILLFGLALSARFWLPALGERDLVQSDRLLVPPIFTYYTNYLSVRELLAPPAAIDPRLINPSPAKGLGLVAALLALTGFIVLILRTQAPTRLPSPSSGHQPHPSGVRGVGLGVFFFFALLAYSLLTLPLSRPIWDHVPLMPFLQFPWRLLGPATLCAAVLAGLSTQWFGKHQAWLVTSLAAAAALGHLSWWHPRACGPFAEITLAHTLQFEYDTHTLGTTATGEFLPVTVHLFPEDDSIAGALMRGEPPHYLADLPPGAHLAIVNNDPLAYHALITTTQAFTATFNQFYFPGWRATLGGEPIAIQPAPDTGLITAPIPAGAHTLRIRFGSTPLRAAGDAISLITLLGLAAYGLWLIVYRRAFLAPQPAPSPAPPPPRSFGIWILSFGFFLALLRPLVIDRFPSPLRRSAFDGERVAGVQIPLRADFAGGVRLHGYDLAPTHLPADGALEAALYVSVYEPTPRRYWPAFTIEDQAGLNWVDPAYFPPRWHREPLPTSQWSPDQYAQWARRIWLLPGAPPGQYRLWGEVFDLDSLQIASLLDEQGNAVAPRFELGTLAVARPRQPFVLQPEIETPHDFGPLALLGYNLSATEAKAGDTLLLTLYWKSEAAPRADYTARVDLVTPNGQSAFGIDLPLVAGYPTSQWQPGDQWRGQHHLRLPASLTDGEYPLSLAVRGEAGAQTLGAIRVTAPTRTFARPEVQFETSASLEGVTVLEGYSLRREGGRLTVTLVWRATETPALSYAAFVHLADDAGRVWAQSDAVPVNWTRPTTGWLADEFIVDAHTLTLPADLPPSVYALFVGLYEPQTGERVPASGPGAGADRRVEIGSVSLP